MLKYITIISLTILSTNVYGASIEEQIKIINNKINLIEISSTHQNKIITNHRNDINNNREAIKELKELINNLKIDISNISKESEIRSSELRLYINNRINSEKNERETDRDNIWNSIAATGNGAIELCKKYVDEKLEELGQ